MSLGSLGLSNHELWDQSFRALSFPEHGVSEHTPAEPGLWFLEVCLVLIHVGKWRMLIAVGQEPLAQQARRAGQELPTSSEICYALAFPESLLPHCYKLIPTRLVLGIPTLPQIEAITPSTEMFFSLNHCFAASSYCVPANPKPSTSQRQAIFLSSL